MKQLPPHSDSPRVSHSFRRCHSLLCTFKRLSKKLVHTCIPMETAVLVTSPGGQISITWPDLSCFSYTHNSGLRHDDLLLPVPFLRLGGWWAAAVKGLLWVLGGGTAFIPIHAVSGGAGGDMAGLSWREVFLTGGKILIRATIRSISSSNIFKTPGGIRSPGPREMF